MVLASKPDASVIRFAARPVNRRKQLGPFRSRPWIGSARCHHSEIAALIGGQLTQSVATNKHRGHE
jgi:hypothetical protein